LGYITLHLIFLPDDIAGKLSSLSLFSLFDFETGKILKVGTFMKEEEKNMKMKYIMKSRCFSELYSTRSLEDVP